MTAAGSYFEVPPASHVYVHVPFCTRRCSYCDFSIAVRRIVPVAEYTEALRREIGIRFPGAPDWRIDTLYLGGGTPSKLGAAGVSAVLGMLRDHLTLAPGAEVTLEANPEDVTVESVAAWVEAGVNRLSLGAQSFDDRVLAWMHRTHSAAVTASAVDAARRGGIENLSLDLIFALPDGVERCWETDVARALELNPSHLSLYGLTVEEHTPLGRWRARGEVSDTPDERYEAEFLHAHEALTHAGFEHYEVSNFGHPGRHSRHNSTYWSGEAYVGLGPAAHGLDGNRRRWNAPAYADWVERVTAGVDPMAGHEELTDENRLAESVYLGLRTTGGLEVSETERPRVQRWVDVGWAVWAGADRIVLTPLGWLRLDALAADLTLVRSHY